MNRVFQFPTRSGAANNPPQDADVLGRIQIDATPHGDIITVRGAFTERMQHGVYALTQALSMFVDRIAESGQAGHTSSPALNESLPGPRKALPPGLASTHFGELLG